MTLIINGVSQWGKALGKLQKETEQSVEEQDLRWKERMINNESFKIKNGWENFKNSRPT